MTRLIPSPGYTAAIVLFCAVAQILVREGDSVQEGAVVAVLR